MDDRSGLRPANLRCALGLLARVRNLVAGTVTPGLQGLA